jgi:hypothetical protein
VHLGGAGLFAAFPSLEDERLYWLSPVTEPPQRLFISFEAGSALCDRMIAGIPAIRTRILLAK